MPAVITVPLVDFWVPGVPKPQGSKRGFLHPATKRVVMVEAAGVPLKDWRYDVKLFAATEMANKTIITQPTGVLLDIEFVMPRPVSLPKTRATPLAVKKPDLDKLARACCDALTKVCYADDSQVVEMRLRKRTAELAEASGARIAVYPLDLPV